MGGPDVEEEPSRSGFGDAMGAEGSLVGAGPFGIIGGGSITEL